MISEQRSAVVLAGIPAHNLALYHRVRFMVGDPAAYAEIPSPDGGWKSVFILRDIETDRARQHANADEIRCPADFTPEGGLSGDRETATAQALAECLFEAGVTHATVDRSLPYCFAHHMIERGIELDYDPDLGVATRRAKDAGEIGHLREAQAFTERLMRMACETIARAEARADGVLMHEGEALTSDRVRTMIDISCLEHGAANAHGSIVACGPVGADCHHRGEGPLRTGQPVIVDIFPMIKATHYNGDCTRTVVHGEVPPAVAQMHAAVVEAKEAAEAAVRPGVTGEAVHLAAIGVIERHGFASGLPAPDADPSFTSMVHGTGHGIGLEVHEPPLLDRKGPTLVKGDALTIEPGLYCKAIGGVRVEDMVVVTANGCENLNRLPTGLTWA
ncbi:MAG: M24 family metallopeptidase [Phycisphaerales bacterium]|nr:M24 family metallopeptidase [Phycisphaerales bacterium]